MVEGLGFRVESLGFETHRAPHKDEWRIGFQVSGFNGVSGFGFQWRFGFRISMAFRISDFNGVSGFGLTARPTRTNGVFSTGIISKSSLVWFSGCKAIWKREFKLPWREAGPPNHHDDNATGIISKSSLV